MASDEGQAWKLNNHTLGGEDDFHPGVLAVDAGHDLVQLWERREPGFIACLGDGQPLEGIATGYPRYDAALGEVVTLERRVEHCSESVLWQRFKQGSKENTQVTTYLRSLSSGRPLAMDLAPAPMRAAYERGEALFNKKVGQLNFACSSCHTPGSVMGHRLRGEVPTTPFGDVAHFPTYRVAAGEVEVLHKRFMRCLKQMRSKPLPPGDPAYVDLEVFYTALSNGHPIHVPSIR
jgi:sulfur-oxidizing protein SoxA